MMAHNLRAALGGLPRGIDVGLLDPSILRRQAFLVDVLASGLRVATNRFRGNPRFAIRREAEARRLAGQLSQARADLALLVTAMRIRPSPSAGCRCPASRGTPPSRARFAGRRHHPAACIAGQRDHLRRIHRDGKVGQISVALTAPSARMFQFLFGHPNSPHTVDGLRAGTASAASDSDHHRTRSKAAPGTQRRAPGRGCPDHYGVRRSATSRRGGQAPRAGQPVCVL